MDSSEQYDWLIEKLKKFDKPGLAVEFLMNWIRENVSYIPGTTDVRTIASSTMVSRSGVCQDFVHLTLAILRTLGIPCRYVSGYLYPGDLNTIGEVVVGESHAWAQVWLGDWYGLDPTNNIAVAERHVLVGWGRDYQDVAPVKGVINGNPDCEMDVSVKLIRIS